MDKSQLPEAAKKSIFIFGPADSPQAEGVVLEDAAKVVDETMSEQDAYDQRQRDAVNTAAQGNGGFQDAALDYEDPEGMNKGGDGKPGESLEETPTAELKETQEDLESKPDPQTAGRRKAIAGELKQRGVQKSLDDLASEMVLGKSNTPDEGIDYNAILEKGEGEGTRGGHVVGHYPSGKPIYKRSDSPLGDKLKHAEERKHGSYHVEDHGAGQHALMFKKPKARYAEMLSYHRDVDSAKAAIERHSAHASNPEMSAAASKVAQAATQGNPVNVMALGKIHDHALAALKEGKSHEEAVAAVREKIGGKKPEEAKKSLDTKELTMAGINGLNEYLAKSTPIGGVTPGGYKKVAEGQYVKQGQSKPSGGGGEGAPKKEPKKREAAPHNEDNVRELGLYEENDGDLHRQSKEPIRANLMRKIAAGKYDHEKAKKLWQYHADRAAQKYTKEMSQPGPHGSHGSFSPSDRKKLASDLADDFKREADAGEHDHHIPKKYKRIPGVEAAAKKLEAENGGKGINVKKSFSGIDELEAFALQKSLDDIYEGVEKSHGLPTGEPKMDQGHGDESPNGGSLESTPAPETSGAKGGSHDPGAPSVPEEKLSEDDDAINDQLKGGEPGMKTTEVAAAKSMTGYTRHELEQTVAKDKAAWAANLRKGQPDVTVGVGVPSPRPPAETLEKARYSVQGPDARVLYSNESDLAVERLMKSDFYAGEEPALGFRPGLVAQAKACGSCGGVMAKSLSACPHCGVGAVAHGFEMSKSEAEHVAQRRGGNGLRPARGQADLILPNGFVPSEE